MMKMNVMHMFLSELCFRVESKVFPELVNNGGLNCTGPRPVPGLVNNGFYTQADIARLVEFAKLRGIRKFLSVTQARLSDSNSLSLLISMISQPVLMRCCVLIHGSDRVDSRI